MDMTLAPGVHISHLTKAGDCHRTSETTERHDYKGQQLKLKTCLFCSHVIACRMGRLK